MTALTHAVIQNASTAGTSIMAMCALARSRAGPVARSTSTNGNGVVGFIQGQRPAKARAVRAADFEACRVGFEAAWQKLLPKVIEAGFQEWRDQRDLTAWKYAMWDVNAKMPTQMPNVRSRCFCGAPIDIADMHRHALTVHRNAP
jgi:hypothetical protein